MKNLRVLASTAFAAFVFSALPALAGGSGSISIGGIPIPTGAGAAAFNESAVTGAAAATGGNWSAAGSVAGGRSFGQGTEAGDPFAKSSTVNFGKSWAAGQRAKAGFSADGFGFGFGRFNNN